MSFVEQRERAGNIPQKYKDLLQTLLNQMETETGNMYQFTVNKFGNPSNYNYIVGDFKNRNMKIEVYDMKLDYKLLEGIYDSRNDILKKIKELRSFEIYEETKEFIDNNGRKFIIGKCKYCHSYNENVGNRCPNMIDSSCCQNSSCPKKSFYTIWDDLHVSEYDGDLYTASGGSISICHTKGKYRFVNTVEL